ncbi:MAG: hypothetical protein COB39_03395 [Marinosulfonomonas sp.]|nr:MAG: hypothetical protein COB39_03395 [Marinosulfonomonas sp.]
MFQFKKPNRPVTKVFIHCSASDNPDHDNVATMDAWHKANGWSGVGYHLFCRKSGEGEIGRPMNKTPAAQKGHNRGSIAICLHGLVEGKFTKAQTDWLIEVCFQINQAYGGKVTFHGHREVANKTCPVIDYTSILKLDNAGRLGDVRTKKGARIVDLGDLSNLEEPEANPSGRPMLVYGAQGIAVRFLQEELTQLGYPVGAIDSDFGGLLRTAVLAFQADNHLIEDGKVGDATYEALSEASPRVLSQARTSKTVAGLALDGSRIAQASMAQGLMGSTFTAGGVLAVLEENTGMVSRLARNVGVYEGILKSLGPWIGVVVVVGGVIVLLQAIKAGRARRDDARTGKTL